MKKNLFILIAFACLVIVSGCSNDTNNVEFKDENGYFIKNDITYKFTGVSEHFSFETGKVYYGENNERYLFIKNFKIINKIKNQKNIDSYFINLYFNNKPLFGGDMNQLENNNFSEKLNQEVIEEDGISYPDGYGESDAFLETTKSNFKKAVKMEIKYCYKDNKCETEIFDFNYVE